MYCPMLVNSYGDSKFCTSDKCAWWDEVERQCAVKSFLISNRQLDVYKILSKIGTGCRIETEDNYDKLYLDR